MQTPEPSAALRPHFPRGVSVIDSDCEFRPCYRFGFDKGSFTPGVGYTSYHAKAQPVCMTRHLNGCPHIGVHLRCGACRATLAEVLDGEERDKPDVCPECGSNDLYWLADMLPEPLPCCDAPDVPKPREGKPLPLRQKCRSCGSTLTGKRLEATRGT